MIRILLLIAGGIVFLVLSIILAAYLIGFLNGAIDAGNGKVDLEELEEEKKRMKEDREKKPEK